MPSCLIVSTALKPGGKTFTLARAMTEHLKDCGMETDLLDLSGETLPACDGAACYGHSTVKAASERVRRADGVIFCSPIYNYQLNSAAKNFIELTNDGWPGKVVGLVANGGSERSFLSILTLANSLWVDHHCLIAPSFVFATGSAFAANGELLAEGEVTWRLKALAVEMHRLITRLTD